jgi:hypothetical protein
MVTAWPNDKNIDIPAENVEQMPIIMTQLPETNTIFNVVEMNRKMIENTFKKGHYFKQNKNYSYFLNFGI